MHPPQDERRVRAWALKEECYAAWHSEPARTSELASRLRSLAAEAADDIELHALAAWGSGIASLAVGDSHGALAVLEQAQRRFESLGDRQHAGETQIPQIVALAMAGRDAEATSRGETALASFEATGDHRNAAKVEGNLGTMLSRQDRHLEAERRWRRAGVRFARLGDREGSIAADVALAYSLAFQFRFNEAQHINARARMRAQTYGYGILHAQALQNTGRIELHRGRWHSALPALAEAAQQMADLGAPPLRCLEAEMALADAYLAVSLLDEAVRLYDGVIVLAARLGATVEQAWATLQRARALERTGDLLLAVAGYQGSRALYISQENSAAVALCDLGLARIAIADRRPNDALNSALAASAALTAADIRGWRMDAAVLVAVARESLAQTDAARSQFQALLSEASDLPQVRLACHAGLGRIALQSGQLEVARAQLLAALDIVERARAALPDDEFRSAASAEGEQVHSVLVEVALREADPARLLDDLDRGRARALALSLPAEHAPGGIEIDGTQLGWLRDQWRAAMAEGDHLKVPALTQQIQALEHTLLESERRTRLTRSRNEGGLLLPEPENPLVQRLQSMLPPEDAFLIWHRHDKQLVACVVTREAVGYRVLATAGLDSRLRALRFQIDALRNRQIDVTRHRAQLMSRVNEHARALYEQLWRPIEPMLQGRTAVVVVPHRELHYLPFAALFDGSRWLAQTHRLSFAPSARIWLDQRARVRHPIARVLAIGAGGPALPHVAREIAAVAAAHPTCVDVRLDEHATLAAWRAQAPTADILHIACHGRFRSDNPAFSYLQLRDAPLTLQDIRASSLRADLVVLSACETGLSRVAPGDELLGMVRAFRLAGAGAVLATLWSVQDGATADLIADFHVRLHAGSSPATALHHAQSEAAGRGAHPFHWAAFVLHGPY